MSDLCYDTADGIHIPGCMGCAACGHSHCTCPLVCAFCRLPGEDLCYWPVERFEPTRLADVQPGDTICRFKESRSRSGVATVETIEPCDLGTSPGVRITLRIKRAAHSTPLYRSKTFTAPPWKMARVLKPGTCDVPICALHSREVDDDRHYCKDHWLAWENVA